MVEVLDRLKSCLYSNERMSDSQHDQFINWLLKSNCSKIGPYLSEERFSNMLTHIHYECLEEIFDVLMRCPEADYFWYTYPEGGGKLTWSEPHHDVVPATSLRVDKEKIKVFLRDIKIQMLLDAN